MKLQTSIKPRHDGTVKLVGKDGKEYVFSKDDKSNALACEIEDEATIKHVLQNLDSHFWPAGDEDMAKAEELLAADDQGEDNDGAGPGHPDDPVDPNALPLEANTPPATAPGRGKKAKSQ